MWPHESAGDLCVTSQVLSGNGTLMTGLLLLCYLEQKLAECRRGDFSTALLTLDKFAPTFPIQKPWSMESLGSEDIPWAPYFFPCRWYSALASICSHSSSSLLERTKQLFQYVCLLSPNNPKCSTDRISPNFSVSQVILREDFLI